MDTLSEQLFSEARQVYETEPELQNLLNKTVLVKGNETFEDAVATTVCYRLVSCNKSDTYCPNSLLALLKRTIHSEKLEKGHTMKDAMRQDVLAVCDRDPATNTLLEVILFNKGFSALVCHRMAFRLWDTQKFTSLYLQSQVSAAFGLDLHPLSQFGAGIMLDHGTGIVTGETATIGDNCTILHGVTLGGTGKETGDRHPKVGESVLIGAGSSLLGNIQVGSFAKIGAGSVVLRSIPSHATAVGAPAKIIGRSLEQIPSLDETLEKVNLLHKSSSAATVSTSTTQAMTTDDETTRSSMSSNDMPLVSVCPFREYQSVKAPKGCLTLKALQEMLIPYGVGSCQVGAVLFHMDDRNVGYVHPKDFVERGQEALESSTKLEASTIRDVVDEYARKVAESNGNSSFPLTV